MRPSSAILAPLWSSAWKVFKASCSPLRTDSAVGGASLQAPPAWAPPLAAASARSRAPTRSMLPGGAVPHRMVDQRAADLVRHERDQPDADIERKAHRFDDHAHHGAGRDRGLVRELRRRAHRYRDCLRRAAHYDHHRLAYALDGHDAELGAGRDE